MSIKPLPGIEAGSSSKAARGSSLIEVLVTLIVVAIGLLGLAGLLSRLQVSEMEAYQRAQALILLNDMASRLSANRANAANYVTANPLGTGVVCPAAAGTRQQIDASEWCSALQGAAETLDIDNDGDSDNVGAMVGGRGCVQWLGGDDYLITVAWQGLTPSSVPASTCGQGSYNGGAGSACTNDRCRRAVTTIVRIGDLSS